MSKLRLMTVVGTRPEIIRLSEIIKSCDEYFEHTFVHTGQNWDYTLNQIFFEDLALRSPDRRLDTVGNNLGETIGNIISESYRIMTEIKPDALLILGDTNSCLACISAKRLKIPVFHIEAGNRCFDENLPEETNRRIVDHTSDVNMCYSENARRYLLSEGAPKERTFVIGSPLPQVLSANAEKIRNSRILQKLSLEKGNYILLSIHREENIDNEKNFYSLMNSVNSLSRLYSMPVIYSTHPRSAKAIEKRGFVFDENVRSLSPFGFSDYNCLQLNSFCVVSDSGTLPEEASWFASKGSFFPAVCVRTSTERPEALETGNFILAGIEEKEVLSAVEVAVKMRTSGVTGSRVEAYTDENTAQRVIGIIQSYTSVINRNVWRKY